jgi:hypothetical protein
LASGEDCPDVAVTLNGSPVTIEFDDDCAFAISDIAPSELVELRVELVDQGIAGTIELSDVAEGELIEIIVTPGDDSLSLAVERRTTPDPSDELPIEIDGNNVSIKLGAGVYDQTLTVRGNHFTLVGEAGESCDDPNGWTTITGDVDVDGNKATFRNIRFEGNVELRGNKAQFINCCFGGSLVIFGNKADIDGDGNDDGDDDDDDDDHDDDDDDDDDDGGDDDDDDDD